MQWNSYFAHQEYALIAMLRDYNENVRNVGVAKRLAHLKSSDGNLPLFGEFRQFCCQKSHFRDSSKSVETI